MVRNYLLRWEKGWRRPDDNPHLRKAIGLAASLQRRKGGIKKADDEGESGPLIPGSELSVENNIIPIHPWIIVVF
jgi:hypothetical protein